VNFSSSSSSCIATPIDPACIYGVHIAPGWSIPRLTQSSDFGILRTGFVSPDDAIVATK
jgi:hypothetical protein